MVDSRALPLFRTQLGKRADALMEVLDIFMRSHEPGSAQDDEANPGVELGAAVIAIRRTQPPEAASRPAVGRRRGR
jgi:hypothetical protein